MMNTSFPYSQKKYRVHQILIMFFIIVLTVSACESKTPVARNMLSTPELSALEPTIQKTTPAPNRIILSVESIDYYAFGYQEYDASILSNEFGGNYEGWKIGGGQIYYINNTGQPIPSGKLIITKAEIETVEGINYPVNVNVPADERAINPSARRDQVLDSAQGNYNKWDTAVTYYVGSKFPIPPGFPIRLEGWSYFTFRFAEAAHPTVLNLSTDKNDLIKIDLIQTSATVPNPNETDIKAAPFSDFSSLISENNDNFTFRFDGTCVIRDNVSEQHVELPFTVENKNQFDELDVDIELKRLVYTPGGFISDLDYPIELKAGPGQTSYRNLSLGLYFTWEETGAPSYLIYLDSKGNYLTFRLECVPEG